MTSDAEPQPAPDTESEVARSEVAGSESVRSEAAQPESAQSESAQSESAQSESAQSESARSESAESESARSESAESESARSESVQPEVAQPRSSQSDPAQSTVETEVTVRRIPRYSRFLIIGAGLGAVATFILTASFPSDPKVGFGAIFGYFILFGVPAGAVIGAVVAILLDFGLTRRARTGMAERTTVDPLPWDDEPAGAEAAAASESPGETAPR
jgi:hypothetical protein